VRIVRTVSARSPPPYGVALQSPAFLPRRRHRKTDIA
jgi:hypothetical protein